MRHLLWIILLISALFALCACKTQKQIQTEYIYIDRTDTLTQFKWRVDSINIHDSIITLIKGDTIITEKWHTQYRDRLRVDTVEKIRTKTIYQTNTKTQIKEVNRLYWWQTAFIWIGAIALAFMILWIVDKLYRKR